MFSCTASRVTVSLQTSRTGGAYAFFLFFLTLVAGPRRSLNLKLSETRVYEPQIRARMQNRVGLSPGEHGHRAHSVKLCGQEFPE